MRASMAIPAVFAPVRLDSMVLVDGGIKNNYPADVARDMGADIIIGVDLGTSDLKQLERINTPWDIVGRSSPCMVMRNTDRIRNKPICCSARIQTLIIPLVLGRRPWIP